jgi:hypothetical protein
LQINIWIEQARHQLALQVRQRHRHSKRAAGLAQLSENPLNTRTDHFNQSDVDPSSSVSSDLGTGPKGTPFRS